MKIRSKALLFRLAEMARKVDGKYKVAAAVLDKKDRVLSFAVNSYSKSHPVQGMYSAKSHEHTDRIYLHAEISAIIKAQRAGRGSPFKIVVVRVGRSGDVLPGKPCKTCLMAIRDAGISTIEHS